MIPTIQSKQDLLGFLENHNLMSLATVDAEGNPQVSDVYFITDDDMNLYFCSRDELRKTLNISAKPHVAIVITSEDHQTTVQIHGTCQPAMNEPHTDLLTEKFESKILSKASGYPPILQMKEGHFVMYKITPTWIRVGQFLEENDDKFTQIM